MKQTNRRYFAFKHILLIFREEIFIWGNIFDLIFFKSLTFSPGYRRTLFKSLSIFVPEIFPPNDASHANTYRIQEMQEYGKR